MAVKSSEKVGTPNATFDPSSWTPTDREPVKRVKQSGVDRAPFHDLIRSLDVKQWVEIPPALTEAEARSAENVVRQSALDLGLSISFLTDTVRNADEKPKDGTSFYGWYVKGQFVPRGPRKPKATA